MNPFINYNVERQGSVLDHPERSLLSAPIQFKRVFDSIDDYSWTSADAGAPSLATTCRHHAPRRHVSLARSYVYQPAAAPHVTHHRNRSPRRPSHVVLLAVRPTRPAAWLAAPEAKLLYAGVTDRRQLDGGLLQTIRLTYLIGMISIRWGH